MRRRRLLIGILLIATAVPIESQIRYPDCVTDKRCPSGAEPPKCCEPPPCQFFEELAVAKAKASFFTRETLAVAMKESGGDPTKAVQMMVEESQSGGAPDWCNVNATIQPRLMRVDTKNGCAIVTPDGRPLTREDAHNDSRTCPEYVDAQFDLMELRRDYCLAGPSRNAGEEVDQYRHEFETQALRLQRDLQEHWGACSSTGISPWARREMEKAGVDMGTELTRSIDLLTLTGGAR